MLHRWLFLLVAALPLEHTCEASHRPRPPRPTAAQCPRPTGQYQAVYTLRHTEGSCDRAKKESHDPMRFDAQGNYLSPVDGVIQCQTAQAGCSLSVRCTSDALRGAVADLDAQLSSDGRSLSGVGTITGYYQGCREVVYDVTATRTDP